MTLRRFSPAWAALPLALAALLSVLAASGFAAQDLTGIYQLLALPLAGVLAFGGRDRPQWVLAGVLSLLCVAAGAIANAWATVQLLVRAGIPEHHLLETSAGLIVLGVPVALTSGVVTAVICKRGWFRKSLPQQPLP